MADIKEMYKNFGISEDVYDYSVKITDALKQRFQEIDIIAEYNQLKVVNAMQKNQVSEAHFAQTTGYGYNDLGRDTLEKVYADIFHTECRASIRRRTLQAPHSSSRRLLLFIFVPHAGKDHAVGIGAVVEAAVDTRDGRARRAGLFQNIVVNQTLV